MILAGQGTKGGVSMRLDRVTEADASPHNNPCAQCGRLIASPVWSEPGDRSTAYLWICEACDYEFTSLAVFARKAQDDRRIAA